MPIPGLSLSSLCRLLGGSGQPSRCPGSEFRKLEIHALDPRKGGFVGGLPEAERIGQLVEGEQRRVRLLVLLPPFRRGNIHLQGGSPLMLVQALRLQLVLRGRRFLSLPLLLLLALLKSVHPV